MVYSLSLIHIFTWTGYEYDEYDLTFKVRIENTGDQPFTVQTRNESINGYMISAWMSADVLTGKIANSEFYFNVSDLSDNGIDPASGVETIELSFHIFNSDSWDTIVDTEAISIALNGITPVLAD